MSQREPTFGYYLIRFVLLAHVETLCVWMTLNLMNGRLNLHSLYDSVVSLFLGIAITDAERTDFTLFISFLHVLPSSYIIADRLMDVKQIDILQSQTFQHGIEAPSVFPSPYSVGQSLLVTHISSRGTPLSLMAAPTPFSLL